MSFNLENYILNEALSSNILRSILNEPSGFFKLSKLFTISWSRNFDNKIDNSGVHNISTDIRTIICDLSTTLSTLFFSNSNYYLKGKLQNTSYYRGSMRLRPDDPNVRENDWTINTGADMVEYTWEDLVLSRYKELSDSEKVRINKEYNNQIENLYSKFKNLLNRPDSYMFNAIIGHDSSSSNWPELGKNTSINGDLLSIMDSNFKKLTFAELKKDILAQEDLLTTSENNVGLYFNKDGYFLGSSSLGMVFLKNTFIKQDDSNNVIFKPIVNRIYEVLKEPDFYMPRAVLKTPLADSKRYLYWPIIATDTYVNDIINQIFHTLGVDGYLNDLWSDMFQKSKKTYGKYISTNKIISPASNLRLTLHWGYNKEDYVIIYKPEHDLNREYTENDTMNALARRKVRLYRSKIKDTNDEAPAAMYKFKKDPLFKTMPYRVGANIQYVTVYDYVLNKFITVKTKSGNAAEFYNKDAQKEKVYFCSNYDGFADIARTKLEKRKIQFSVMKSIKSVGDELSQKIYDSQIGIADRMKKCDEISSFIKQHFKEISKDDVRNLNMLIFKTDLITSYDLSNVIDLLPEEDRPKLKQVGLRPYAGIQNEMNRIIILSAEANLKLNKIIENSERYFKQGSIHSSRLESIADDAKKLLNEIINTYKVNFENVDLYFKICDKILEKYK